ncbi:MAG: tetratricopeptide repeat protein [Gemmatimonadetes bacterium]|nr:tetratricopeptide repeat protein [Gemmatimonadota bacterium]
MAAAFTAYWSGETDSAATLYHQALQQSRTRADPANEAKALTGLARVAYRRSDYQEARRLGQESLELKRQRGLHGQLFDSHNLLGLIALHEGRYSEAISQHGTARELAEAAADTTNLAKVWTNLALSHIELGEFAEARVLLTRALPAARVSRDGVIEGRVLTNLGMLAVRTGYPDSAVPLLTEGLAILRIAGDGDGEQNNLGQLGTAYAALGDLARAIGYLDSAVAQARRTESPREEASDLEQLAALHREAGEFPRALALLERAREINTRLGLIEETGLNLRAAADIHLELDNPEIALSLVDSAVTTHRAGGRGWRSWETIWSRPAPRLPAGRATARGRRSSRPRHSPIGWGRRPSGPGSRWPERRSPTGPETRERSSGR